MRYLTIILCAVLVLFCLHQAQAKIIHVPDDSSTIQAGIDGAVNGDTVLVASGTYYEYINFYGKAILVRSEVGPASTAVNKLYNEVAIVTFNSGEGSSSEFKGPPEQVEFTSIIARPSLKETLSQETKDLGL